VNRRFIPALVLLFLSVLALSAAEAPFDWPAFLAALEAVEAPHTERQAAAAVQREGAYGILQIRQSIMEDVFRNIVY